MAPADCKAFRDMGARLVQMLLYLDKLVVGAHQIPLAAVLHHTLQKRVMKELFARYGGFGDYSTIVQFSTRKIIGFLIDVLGFILNPLL